MNIKESFISVFTNWKNFHGRACRSEYWYFVLSVFLIAFVLAIVEILLGIFRYTVLVIIRSSIPHNHNTTL